MASNLTEHLLANKVIQMGNFFSRETAEQLYDDMSANAVFLSSVVSDRRGDTNATEDTVHGHIYTESRVSETAFHHSYSQLSRELLEQCTEAIADLLGVETDRFEPWQCTRYGIGGKFDYHDDCGNWASNERLYTVLFTVRGAYKGGSTHFQKLGIEIPSETGSLIIWRNLNEDYLCDGMALHAGLPVEQGEKMILVTWVRRFTYVP